MEQKKGFTTLELMIAVSLLGLILVGAYALFGRPTSHSKSSIQETNALGSARRVLILLNQRFRKAKRILYPNEDQKTGLYCLVENKDGTTHQYYYDSAGNFVHRYRKEDMTPGLEVIVRKPVKGMVLNWVKFEMKNKSQLDFSAAYRVEKDGKSQELVEIFDTIALQ